jgi:hypothetical protein
MIATLHYRLWWTWAKFRLGSDVLLAAGYRAPKDGGEPLIER